MVKGIKWCITILIVVIALGLVGLRVFGLRPYTVLSGSMEPTYHVGSLIYVENVSGDEISKGDPVTFILDENLNIATHRAVRIDKSKEYIYTKGDANQSEDGQPVHFNNVIGRPVFSIPYLGFVSNWISNILHKKN